jgi:hypothetical protein
MRSSAGSWNGTKHVFNNLSTNNLKQKKKSYLQLQTFYDQEWQAEKTQRLKMVNQ